MNGIKVNLDSSTVSLVKKQFSDLISYLESKAQVKLNIDFGSSISSAGNQINSLKEQMNGIMGSVNLSSGFKSQMDKNVVTAKEDVAKIKGSFEEIEAQYKKLGNYKITPTKYDENGNLKNFTVQLEQVEGLIDKINYKTSTSIAMPNGQLQSVGYSATGITETNRVAEVNFANAKKQETLDRQALAKREESLQYEQKIRIAIEQEQKSNIDLVAQEENKLKLIQMQYAEKIKLLRANNSSSSTSNQINSLESNVSGLASIGAIGQERLKNEYSEIVRLQAQLNSEKQEEQRITAQAIISEMRLNEIEAQRIAKMGQSQGTLSSGFFAQSNKEIMQYGKSLLNTNETMKSFQRTQDSTGNSIIKMTSSTKLGNGQMQLSTRTFDANTNSVYKNEGAIKMGASGLENMAKTMKSTITSMVSFALVTGSLYGALSKLKEGFSFINDMNKAETNIKMVTGMSDESVQKLTKTYSDLATTLHETTSEIYSASEAFLRAGNSQKDTESLLQASTVMSKIAGQTQKESSESIIAMMNAYKLSANDMMGVVDKMVAVDNTSATSTAELSDAIQRVASSAQSAKITLPELISYIGTISSVTRQSAESIGTSMNSIIARFTSIKEGKEFDPDNDPLNNVEKSLNRYGIAVRSSANTFKSLSTIITEISSKWNEYNDVQKNDISTQIAGTRQKNQFLTLMNNQKMVLEQQTAQANSAGNALNRYNVYAESTEARLNDLTNASQKMWMSLIHSSTINSFIGAMTNIVTVMGRTASGLGSINTMILLLSTSIVLLNSKAIGSLITNFLAMATGETILASATVGLSLAVESLGASMLALLTNPVTWIIASISLVVSGIIAWTNHQQKLKEQTDAMTESQKNLNQAIRDQDMTSMKSEYDKQKSEYDKLDKLKSDYAQKQKEYDKLSSSNTNSRFGSAEMNKLSVEMQKESKAIDEQEKLLKGLNSTMDDYLIAKSLLYAQDNADKINKEAKAEFDNKQNIISLIQEYQNLEDIENKNATQKERLSQLSEELNGKISNLKLTRDKEGNTIISNSDLLGKQINILQTEGSTVETLANVKLTTAKNEAEIEIGKTKVTYTEAKKRIEMYKLEAKSASDAIDSAKTKTEQENAIRGAMYSGEMHGGFIDTYSSAISALDKIYSIPTPKPSSTENGYKPPSGGGSSSSKEDVANLDNKLDRYYKLNSALQSIETELSKINTLESNATESEKIKLKEQEIKLLDQKKIALQNIYKEEQNENRSNAEILKNQDVKFDSKGNISNKNEILTTKTNASNKLTGDAKKASQESIKQLEADIQAYEDLRFSKMVDTSSKIFTLESDRINKLAELETSKFNVKLENIDKTYGKESQQIEDVKYKLEELNTTDDNSKEYFQQKVKLTEDLIKATQDYNTQLLTGYGASLDLLNSTKEGTEEWDKANANVEEYKDKLKSTNLELLGLNKSLEDISKEKLNKIQEIQDKIGQVITKQYENEQKEALKSIDNIQKARDISHKYVMDSLAKEKKANEDIFNDKLSQIDKEENAQNYTDNSSKLLNEKTSLQKQYDLLSLDSSREAIIKREEIAKQIADKQTEIDKLAHDRSTDLRKENIKTELEDYQKMMDARIEGINSSYEAEKETLEQRKVDIEDYYNNKLKQSNIFIESQEALESGYIDRIKKQVVNGFLVDVGTESATLDNALTSYLDNYENGLSVTGGLIKTELIDNLTTVLGLVSELQTKGGIDIGNTNIKTPITSNSIPNISSFLPTNLQDLINNITMPSIKLPNFNIPSLTGLVGNSKSGGVTIDNLINIEGNVDKNVVADLKLIGQDTANRLAKLWKESGR